MNSFMPRKARTSAIGGDDWRERVGKARTVADPRRKNITLRVHRDVEGPNIELLGSLQPLGTMVENGPTIVVDFTPGVRQYFKLLKQLSLEHYSVQFIREEDILWPPTS